MFALLNPPRGKKRKAAKGKRRRAKKAKLLKRSKRLSSIFTPGGGVIRRIAANRAKYNPFLGINPKSHRFAAVHQKGATVMAKRRHRRNGMSISRPTSKGIFDALKPKNLVGVTPILAGVIVNGLATKVISDKVPYTKKGIGNIALGLINSGLMGMLGRYANKQIGDGIFVGGVVGTLGCAFQSFMKDGVRSLSLSDDLDGLSSDWASERFGGNLNGLDNFTTPQAIMSAQPSEGAMAQYSLPQSNAQFMPRMAPPQTPMQAQQARGVSDYEQSTAIGAVLGGEDDISGIM